MAFIVEQKNAWGAQNGLNAQRTDLWQLDLKNARDNLDSQLDQSGLQGPSTWLEEWSPQFAQSVSLPGLKTGVVNVRRGSRVYAMPGDEQALETTKIRMMFDSRPAAESSHIYRLFRVWRMFVRAGRGQMSIENRISLNSFYRIDYAFNIGLRFLRGSSNPSVVSPLDAGSSAGTQTSAAGLRRNIAQVRGPAGGNSLTQGTKFTAIANASLPGVAAAASTVARYATTFVVNNLEESSAYTLVAAWPSSFAISELSYEGSKHVMLEIELQAADLLDDTERLK